MSYGYQGPPYPGNNPPTSFGAPPGAPSAPHAPSGSSYPSNNSFGFSNSAPTSFNNMPQPFTPYPPNSSQPQPMQSPPYPTQMGGPAPYPQSPQYPLNHNQPAPFHQAPAYPMQPSHQHFLPTHPPNIMPTQYTPAMPTPYPPTQTAYNTIPQPSMPTPAMHAFPPSQGTYSNNSTFSSGASYPRAHDNKSLYPSISGHSQASPKMQVKPKLSPTAVPYPDFDSRADAEILRKAMKGFGTDEKAIINVLANRSNLQRQEIAVQFKTLYGKDLIKDLKSELSGKFEDLIVAMMTPLPQYYAHELHHAISGIGTNETVLIEIMCTMSNHEIRVIRSAYESMFGKTLEDDFRDDTSGNFKRLMVSLCCGNRDESFNVDPAGAAEDARRLLQAGEMQFGTDESTFNAILVSRNTAQLKQIFMEYQSITGHSIEQAIENEFSGDIKKALLAIVHVIHDRAGYFAEQLYKSMKGMGTEDRRLIRLVVTRSEIDMGEIKDAFYARYGKSLMDTISDDCSGHYKKCLLALIA